MSRIKQVSVSISGAVNGEPMLKEYTGEYEYRDNTHNIAYTDYTGNIITKCALQASGLEMLHVTGHGKGKRQDHLGKSSVPVHHVLLSRCHRLGR